MAHSEEDDVKALHHMGYAQELARRMGGFSNFAISFSIICILAGGITAFPLAMRDRRRVLGRRSAGSIGGLFALVVAASPRRRSPRPIRPPAASITGPRSWAAAARAGSDAWINLLGLIFVVASVNVGVYLLFSDLVWPACSAMDVSGWGTQEQVIAVVADHR